MLIAFAAVAFLATAPAAPSYHLSASQAARIDDAVRTHMDKDGEPGVALGIFSRGTVVYAKGYGLADRSRQLPVRADTVFESGSLAKQFTATAVMMLLEQGRISLDDSIARYFPDAPKTWRPIRIKNLLSHTSGIEDYADDDHADDFDMHSNPTESQILRKFEAMPLDFSPGAKYDYSNTNYALLGFIIERVSGQSYASFLRAHIFSPLGMSSTGIIGRTPHPPHLAQGYEMHGRTMRVQDWVSPAFNSLGDGSLYFDVFDLAKWDAALYTNRLLTHSSLERMWTVYRLNNGKENEDGYGFGWWMGDQNGHLLIEHDGSWQGFATDISRYPDDSLTIAVLTNLDGDHSDPDGIAHDVAAIVNDDLIEDD